MPKAGRAKAKQSRNEGVEEEEAVALDDTVSSVVSICVSGIPWVSVMFIDAMHRTCVEGILGRMVLRGELVMIGDRLADKET